MFIIGDVKQFSWVALVLANGTQIHFNRISPGTSYADGVFEDTSDGTEFFGARITWDVKGAWIVSLRNGTQYTVHGCNASSKPGQCAVTELKNAQGERLVVQRDLQGRLHRITSPHGHFIDFQTDSEGHILHAQDDSGNWVSYTYDKDACLISTNNWRKDHQEFRYDAKFNMVYVHESGPHGRDGKGLYNFSLINRFDSQNRLAYQRVSTGDRWSVRYQSDSQGRIRQTAVRDNIGLARYFFDEAGYGYREEYEIANQKKWVLEHTWQPRTHKLVNVTLSCWGIKKNMPLNVAEQIDEMGEGHKAILTEFCREVLKRTPIPPDSTKSGL